MRRNVRMMSLALILAMLLTLTACGGKTEAPAAAPAETQAAAAAAVTGVEDGILTVGMECAYAPYNWTQMDDSNGAVPIANNPGSFANAGRWYRPCGLPGWRRWHRRWRQSP